MKYIGSKNRLSKEIAPIIQSYITEHTKGYLEPFVGGGNMIDKIKCDNKIGYDIHKQLIALLNQAKVDTTCFPETITEEEYYKVKNNKENYEDWYVGLVGFCASFSARYFSGYARAFKNDKTTPRDMPNEAIRNIKKQAPNLKGITFECKNFLEIKSKDFKGYVIYCDIPYRDTTKYATGTFPYEEFYQWCREMSKNNTILISEYYMPEDFTCIWKKKVKVNFDSKRKERNKDNNRVEKLYTYKTN